MLLTRDTPECFLYEIYLNGENVTRSLAISEANEEAGYLLCLEQDSKGRAVISEKTNEPVTFILRGRVTVILPKEEKPCR